MIGVLNFDFDEAFSLEAFLLHRSSVLLEF